MLRPFSLHGYYKTRSRPLKVLLDPPEDVPHQHWLRGKNMNRIYNDPAPYPKDHAEPSDHTFVGGTKITTYRIPLMSVAMLAVGGFVRRGFCL